MENMCDFRSVMNLIGERATTFKQKVIKRGTTESRGRNYVDVEPNSCLLLLGLKKKVFGDSKKKENLIKRLDTEV